jgi:hypothetical protein
MTRADARTREVTKLSYLKPCGSRLAEKCPHCSEVYRRDAISDLRGGLQTVENATIPFTFITFTAPGAAVFGPTHQRVVDTNKGHKSQVRKCGCRKVHAEDDPLIGTPLNADTYRYDLAADFNAHASRLFSVTMQRLGRVVGHKLVYTRVAEFQTRGLVHYHVIVKSIVTERSVQTVVRGGTDLRIIDKNKKILERREAERLKKKAWKKECKKSGHETPYDSDYKSEHRRNPNVNAVIHGEWTWGAQVDVPHVLPGGKFGVGAYLVKLLGYAVKGTDTSANGPYSHRRKMQSAALRNCRCHAGLDCARGSRLTPDKTAFYQSAPSKKFCRRHQLAYNGWGFRGHVLAFSRKWGMTFKEVRAKRKTFATTSRWMSDRYVVMGWSVSSRGSPLIA